jgi:hypothetical protein
MDKKYSMYSVRIGTGHERKVPFVAPYTPAGFQQASVHAIVLAQAVDGPVYLNRVHRTSGQDEIIVTMKGGN